MKTTLFVLVLCTIAAAGFAQEKAAPAAAVSIASAKLGTSIADKQIVGEDTTFALNEKVYLWLKVKGGPSDSLTVTWKHESHSYETKLAVGGNPWRTWTYKTAAWAGPWTVAVADNMGNILKELNFEVVASKK